MMSRFFQDVPVALWTEISVLVFFTVFLVILAWVFLPVRARGYEDASRLPLEGGDRE